MSVSSPHSQTSVFTLEEKEACSQITVQHLFRKCWVWFPSSDFLTSSPPYSPSLWIRTLGTHGISLIYRYKIAQKQTPQKPGTCLLMCDVGGGGAGSKEFSAELVGYVLVFVAYARLPGRQVSLLLCSVGGSRAPWKRLWIWKPEFERRLYLLAAWL